MKILSNIFPVALLAMALVWTGCDDDDNGVTEPDPEPTIVEVAQDGGFSTLVAAVEAADLVSTLESDGPFTVFAPTDAAFDALPDGTVASLLEPDNKDQLTSILTYHVVAGRVPASQVVTLTTAETVQGENVDISVIDGAVQINGANVVQTDIEASNGIIHVIDSVLLPPSAGKRGKATAPGQQVDTIADIVINSAGPDRDGEFSTLLAALEAADLAGVFAGDRQLTVFAPTNEAFEKLDPATLAFLLDPENKQALIDILTYHVVPGSRYSGTVLNQKRLNTLNGGFISVDAENVALTDAQGGASQIVGVDIPASNGVIHTIDTVLIP